MDQATVPVDLDRRLQFRVVRFDHHGRRTFGIMLDEKLATTVCVLIPTHETLQIASTELNFVGGYDLPNHLLWLYAEARKRVNPSN